MRRDTLLGMLAIASAMIWMAACGDDGGDGGEEPMEDGGVDAGMAMPMDGGVDGGPAPEDGNDGFEDAVALSLNTPLNAQLDFVGDVDWYSFETTEANQWVLVRVTETVTATDVAQPDPAVIVYDADQEPFAANTDLVGPGTAGELVMRLPTAGTWYAVVSPETAATGSYQIIAGAATPRDGIVLDAENGDDAASATDVGDTFPNLLIGDFEDDSDVDAFAFEIDVEVDRVVLFGGFYQGGRSTEGEDGITLASGSTARFGRVWVTTQDAPDTVIALIDPAAYPDGVGPVSTEPLPSLTSGRYILWIEADGEAVGDNPYYFGRVTIATENTPEANDAANDSSTTPDPIEFTGDAVQQAFILSTLGDGDVDHWSLAPRADEIAVVSCSSRLGGSGVEDLEVSILTGAGAVLNRCGEDAASPCTDTESLAEGGIGLVAGAFGDTLDPTTYLLRIRKGGQVAGVVGNWVRCGVQTGPPADPNG